MSQDDLEKRYGSRRVILVDELDNEIGTASLIEAHRGRGLKHRALSLCLWRQTQKGREWLLQQRATEKPIFPELWANTCCYNLAPGENYKKAAVKRVWEEMGIKLEEEGLRLVGRFSYFAPDKNGWCENEVDTVIVGEWDGEVKPNPEEVKEWEWLEEVEIERQLRDQPEKFAPWFFKVWEIVNME